MARLFGTDGIRGLANAELTPELAMAVSVAAVHVLGERIGGRRPVAVVGRDPRASGVMLSASHNPMADNGIKIFARGGHKLPDAVEDEIEARLGERWARPTGAGVGRVRDLDDAVDRYADHVFGALPHKL